MFWLLMFLLVVPARYAAAEGLAVGKPGCRTKCGNSEVPFPFGIDPGCSLEGFNLTCRQNALGDREKLFSGDFEVLDILLPSSQVRMNNPISFQCYKTENSKYNLTVELNLTSTRFRISQVHNRLVAVGCDTLIYNTMVDYKNDEYQTVCVLVCYSKESLVNGSCFGIGCCESAVPPGINYYKVSFGQNFDYYERDSCFFASNLDSQTLTNFSPCSYAVLMEADDFSFRTSYVSTSDFWESRNGHAPILMDWSISDETCKEAQRNKNYACVSRNSVCKEQTIGIGYSCNCSQGYEGNPYLVDGCQDIDECAEGINICSDICINTPGSYLCSCRPGTHVDPKRPGACYQPDHKMPIGITIAIGVSAGATLLSLVLCILVLIRRLEIRRKKKLKRKFFKQNHGLLLQRLISSTEETDSRMKIFSLEELEKATNKFDQARILGCGGHGTVYKGILSDLRVVAIKRAKTMEQSEIDQFINEVVILSQINHRNVVKLFGCCLEAEVPLLVNEFISNGTLSDHLHVRGENSLQWTDRLRIALEIARAISYLHSAASMSIFHRDIKCSNILLDDYLTAKLSDFGASKSVQIDQTGITTAIQGTYGYLDPEYYYTGRLTEKSDVYSFGVILTELLTREKVYLTRTSLESGSLIARFVTALTENRLFEILDSQIVEEGPREQLEEVAILTERCLRLKGEERPGMKEVEIRLEVIICGPTKDFGYPPTRRPKEL